MDLGDEESSPLKRRRQEEGGGDTFPVDRISNLPEPIISHLLSLLPTKSAAATAFLSKSWRLRWTKITAFDFDDQQWPNGESQLEMNFSEFIKLVFVNHTESIRKLRLRWQSRNIRPVSLHTWLNAAIGRNIRDLDLAAVPPSGDSTPEHGDEEYEFKLPAALYNSPNLEVLKLRGPFRVKHPHMVSLPKLTVLELIYVKYECDESFEKLLSACPVLHSLKIKRCHYHGDLLVCKVSSLSLKRAEIYFDEGCNCASVRLKLVIDTPALEHLVIDSVLIAEIRCVQQAMPVNELDIFAVCDDGVAGIIRASDGVKAMKLWETAILALGRSTTPLPATFGRLTNLVIYFTSSHWSYLMDLIDRCIKLQVLDITVCDMEFVDEAELLLESLGGSFWRHPVRVPGCLLSSLKHVYFRSFVGCEDEMAMLKFILERGLLVETVTLCFGHGFLYTPPIDDTKKLNILNKVLKLRRASAACTISFT